MGKGIARVCVFCGSNPGARPGYAAAARGLARVLVERGVGLVYGGGGVGLMGVLADTVVAGGGEVIGVIPQALVDREKAARNVEDLRVVDSMHQRKALLAELSDAFVALPGGLGTLEELFEALTWAQLGIHSKPCALLDAEGFYSPLVAALDHAVRERFVATEHRAMLLVERDPETLLDRLAAYRPPAVEKWLDSDET